MMINEGLGHIAGELFSCISYIGDRLRPNIWLSLSTDYDRTGEPRGGRHIEDMVVNDTGVCREGVFETQMHLTLVYSTPNFCYLESMIMLNVTASNIGDMLTTGT